MSTIICKFCGRETETQYHEYCHFLNVYRFGGEAADKAAIEEHKISPEYKSSQMYKDVTVGSINSLTIDLAEAKWNSSKQKIDIVNSSVSLFKDLNGSQCYKSIVISEPWIAHFNNEVSVPVKYTIEGKEKTVSATLNPDDHEGLWHLGLHINENLNLEIWLCIEPINGIGKEENILLNTINLELLS